MTSDRQTPNTAGAVLVALLIAALLAGWCLEQKSHASAPQMTAISSDLSAGWVPFGGAWRSEGQEIIGESEDRGPKLMNGSLDWQNYFVEADVRLLGAYGEAGIIIRSSGEEEGVDSYHGYFVGVRNMDNSVLLGRADYGWDLFVLRPILPKVDGWYHIQLLAYDCSIAAAITDMSGLNQRLFVTDPHCIAKGRFGLKSYGTSAAWRNLHVGPAGLAELQNLTRGIQPALVNYNSDAPESGFSAAALAQYLKPLRREAAEHKFQSTTEAIGSLGLSETKDSDRVTVRGIATIVRPVLYVQDSTGAILLKPDGAAGLVRVGDEVEAQGVLSSDRLSPVLDHASVRVLWPDSQILPIVVTPFELAAGRNNGRFVETDGTLLSQSLIANHSVLLKMENDSQEFYAITDNESASSAKRIEPGSRLRLRGVASSDPAFTENLVPFAILLPSLGNVQVIGPPPWWTATHIALILTLLLLLAGAAHLSLIRMQRWRHEVVLRERERIAVDIHDTLAQSFAGIGFQLQAMRADATGNEPMQKQLEVTLNMVRRSHNEAKRSFATIESAIDSGPNIAESLRQTAEQLSAGRALVIHASSQGPTRRIPKSAAETIFRVGQEAIYNCIRHSGASRLDISLNIERNMARLTVADNGSGFIVDSGNHGFGLRGMSRRAENVSAHLEIASAPGSGTTVFIIVPIGPFSTFRQPGVKWLRQISNLKADTNGKTIGFNRHSNSDS